jgi:hypothetical protein
MSGWEWFDINQYKSDAPKRDFKIDRDLPFLFAKVFHGPSGELVLRHLNAVTLGRSLGPNSTDAVLRHLEGQRHLISYINSLVKRGSGRPQITVSSKTATNEPPMENEDD